MPRIQIFAPNVRLDLDWAIGESNGGVSRKCGREVCSAEDPNLCADGPTSLGSGY